MKQTMQKPILELVTSIELRAEQELSPLIIRAFVPSCLRAFFQKPPCLRIKP